MRTSAWVAALSVAFLAAGFGGCGSVEPAGTGAGGESGSQGGTAGTTGTAGTNGTVGTAGTTGTGGTTGTAGTGGGNAGNAGSPGSGGSVVGGRGGGGGATGSGGAASGRGGSDGSGTAGRGGAGGNGGTGGPSTGGRGGGAGGIAGTLGTVGTGGTLGGRGGGSAGSTGATGGATGGAGGPSAGGRGGGAAGASGTGGGPNCSRGTCPALMISDLEAIDDSKAPGFDATGFRCKSLTICQNATSCVYYAMDMLGSLQSTEDTYTDGAERPAAAVKLVIDVGAASQCGNPPVTFTADDLITLTFDGGKKLAVYLPMFMGTSLTLYIASDGSTFTDAALTTPARLRP